MKCELLSRPVTRHFNNFLQLSFRAAISLRDRRLSEVRATLGADGDAASEPSVARLLAAATRVLHETAHSFPLGEAERTVINQVSTVGVILQILAVGSQAAAYSTLDSPRLCLLRQRTAFRWENSSKLSLIRRARKQRTALRWESLWALS